MTVADELRDPAGVCTGLDVPTNRWTAEDVAYWSSSPSYQPWKDIAALFKGTEPPRPRLTTRFSPFLRPGQMVFLFADGRRVLVHGIAPA